MSDHSFTILVINPGSTSTKIAIYQNEKPLFEKTLVHPESELHKFTSIVDQLLYRESEIEACLLEQKIATAEMDAVVGRGGLFKPMKGGTYRVNEAMLADAKEGRQGQHPSNLGCLLAYKISREAGCPAFVVDPVSVDEFEPLARYSGHKLLTRRCLSHALNLHIVARKTACQMGIALAESSFVVAHLGGGISIAPLKAGNIIDVNDASSAGPFSPDRSGTLPLQGFVDLCFSGKFSKADIKRMVMGNGGLKSYLGTGDAAEVEKRIRSGDGQAREVIEAMAYQIAKEIGAMATVVKGNVHAIILTGGLAKYSRLVNRVKDRVAFIAPIVEIPGEFEMEALAMGALRVLRGEEEIREY